MLMAGTSKTLSILQILIQILYFVRELFCGIVFQETQIMNVLIMRKNY